MTMFFSVSGCLKESRIRLGSSPQARACSLKGARLICSTSTPASGPPMTRGCGEVSVCATAAEASASDSRAAARQLGKRFIPELLRPRKDRGRVRHAAFRARIIIRLAVGTHARHAHAMHGHETLAQQE